MSSSTSNRWTVEPMKLEMDLEGILEIDASSFQKPWGREMLKKELSRPGLTHIFVVRSTEVRVVGYCAAWVVVDELHINSVAVRSDWRGRGAARALIDYVLDWSRSKNVYRATLEVRRSNERARALYKRLNFKLAGIRRNYYSNPREDALILSREKRVPELETSVCV